MIEISKFKNQKIENEHLSFQNLGEPWIWPLGGGLLEALPVAIKRILKITWAPPMGANTQKKKYL